MSDSTRHNLLQHLSDNAYHSGESLGQALGLSRAAIWKQIQALQTLGLDFDASRSKGYRLLTAVELLDVAQIRTHLSAAHAQTEIVLFDEIDSTNSYLMQQLSLKKKGSTAAPYQATVCLSEIQTAGRGRRGRAWLTPYGSAVAFSLFWPFQAAASQLAGLSLATGVVVAEAIESFRPSPESEQTDDPAAAQTGIRLKWPNDLWLNDRKLGGILIEVSGDAAGPCDLVIGIGLNVNTADTRYMENIDQPWTDMCELFAADPLAQAHKPSRNALVAKLMDGLLQMLPVFEQQGFAAYAAAYQQRDALMGREVYIQRGEQTIHGIARGVDQQGGFLFEHAAGLEVITAGEVSVRPKAQGVGQ